MTLQKLVHLDEDEATDLNSDDATIGGTENTGSFLRSIFWGSRSKRLDTEDQDDPIKSHAKEAPPTSVQKPRTIQRYRGGRNQERAAYMERHSALTKNKLAVSAEQVSIFLTAGKMDDLILEHC
jgi:hypothetical protein